MQLKNDKPRLDFKALERTLVAENKFITDLFSIVAFPDRYDENAPEEDNGMDDSKPVKLPQLQGDKKSRATSIAELQKRLNNIQSKKNVSFKEKLQKKNLKNKMKKKNRAEDRNAEQKLIRAQKLTEKTESKPDVKPAKPVYNSEGKMVFSKFDFSGLGKNKDKKQEKDPKKILQNLKKQKEKLQQLEAGGEMEKAVEIKEKVAWKNALAKSQGDKVKDDPELLKKSVKRQEQQKRTSKKKWEKRIETVAKAKDERQQKRTDNIEKRKKDKNTHKKKMAAKRGRIIPGF